MNKTFDQCTTIPDAVPSESSSSLTGEDVQRHWTGVVGRRSFLKGIGLTGATLSAGALLVGDGNAQSKSNSGKLSPGDVALLQFALWAETVESDLGTQYAELGGVGPSGGGAAQAQEEFQGFIGGNPAYTLALQNLDGDMPQYISDNTDDELSHASFLKNFLISKGADVVDLSTFATLQPSQVTGVPNVGRLTNLTQLTVDTSWWTRYRSATKNPDLGDTFDQAVPGLSKGKFPAIPRNDGDLT